MESNSLFATQTIVWGLRGMCTLRRVPFAANLVLQQVPPPCNLNSLQQAAAALGPKSGIKQAFLTEYVSRMETVKSLQIEPQLNSRFGEYLAAYLKADFGTRQLSNSFEFHLELHCPMVSKAIVQTGQSK